MKEKKVNDIFSTIRLEEDDDFDLFAKSVGTSLYIDRAGKRYCCYSVHNETRVVMYDPIKKAWLPLNKDEIAKLEFDKYKLISFEESMEIYKIYPPFEALDSIKNKKAIERLKAILKLRKATPHKVIGWVDNASKRSMANDIDNSYFAAVINDISEHHYFFYGDMMELMPVFEDNTYVNYSSRVWGDIIALSKNMSSDFDYSLFSWNSGKNSIIKEPSLGFYEKLTLQISVDEKLYNNLNKYIANFYELRDDEMANYYGAKYILLIDDCDYYDQIGTIEIKYHNNALYFDVNFIKYLESDDELNELIESLKKELGFDMLVLGDYDKVKERLKLGPALIAILHE